MEVLLVQFFSFSFSFSLFRQLIHGTFFSSLSLQSRARCLCKIISKYPASFWNISNFWVNCSFSKVNFISFELTANSFHLSFLLLIFNSQCAIWIRVSEHTIIAFISLTASEAGRNLAPFPFVGVWYISFLRSPFLSFPFSSRLLKSSLLTLSGSQTNFPTTTSTVTERLLAAFQCLHLQFSERGLLLCALVHGCLHNDTGPNTKAWSWLKTQESHSCITMNVGFMGAGAKGLSFSIRSGQQRTSLNPVCWNKLGRALSSTFTFGFVAGLKVARTLTFQLKNDAQNRFHPSISGSGSLHGAPWFAALYTTCRT